jgi:hypothetical protein
MCNGIREGWSAASRTHRAIGIGDVGDACHRCRCDAKAIVRPPSGPAQIGVSVEPGEKRRECLVVKSLDLLFDEMDAIHCVLLVQRVGEWVNWVNWAGDAQASSSATTTFGLPAAGMSTATRIFASISSASSGCSRRNSRALSLPCPILSPLYAYQEPDFSTMR